MPEHSEQQKSVLARLVTVVEEEGLVGLASASKRSVRRMYVRLANAGRTVGEPAGSGRTSITDDDTYPAFCQRAADDPKVFSRFRSNPAYVPVLEHVSQSQGRDYLDEVLRDSELASRLPRIIANDDVGGPLQFPYPEVGMVSPTTLRYVKVLSDLRRLFGDLEGCTIAEIGVGYGGQCKVISRMYELSTYELLDLPSVDALAEKFLRASDVTETRLHFRDGLNPPTIESDLLLSNYAFSELRRDTQEAYFERVVRHARRGYVTYNHTTPEAFESMTAEEFVARIPGAKMEPEVPLTHPDNVVVVWGADH